MLTTNNITTTDIILHGLPELITPTVIGNILLANRINAQTHWDIKYDEIVYIIGRVWNFEEQQFHPIRAATINAPGLVTVTDIASLNLIAKQPSNTYTLTYALLHDTPLKDLLQPPHSVEPPLKSSQNHRVTPTLNTYIIPQRRNNYINKPKYVPNSKYIIPQNRKERKQMNTPTKNPFPPQNSIAPPQMSSIIPINSIAPPQTPTIIPPSGNDQSNCDITLCFAQESHTRLANSIVSCAACDFTKSHSPLLIIESTHSGSIHEKTYSSKIYTTETYSTEAINPINAATNSYGETCLTEETPEHTDFYSDDAYSQSNKIYLNEANDLSEATHSNKTAYSHTDFYKLILFSVLLLIQYVAQSLNTTYYARTTHSPTDLFELVLFSVLIFMPSIKQTLTQAGFVLNGIYYGTNTFLSFVFYLLLILYYNI
eukprot:105649_1